MEEVWKREEKLKIESMAEARGMADEMYRRP
jgi:hypothetical protein